MSLNRFRLVFDANVIVSASLNSRSTSAKSFYRAIEEGTILLSQQTLREIRDVNLLHRDKFNRYVSREIRDRFLHALVRNADLVKPTVRIRECRDPDDDTYLALAVHTDARCIVSGDKDLLVLHPFRGIPIMRPDQFLEWVEKNKN